MVVDKTGGEIRVRPQRKIKVEDVDQKFAKTVDDFISGHEDVLQKLAHK